MRPGSRAEASALRKATPITPPLSLPEGEPAPALAPPSAPSPADVTQARGLVHRLRALSNGSDTEAGPLQIAPETMNAALRMSGRMLEGFRGAARIEEDRLVLSTALPVFGGRGWINADLVVPPFAQGPQIERLRLGRLDLPGATALGLIEGAADIWLGQGAAERIRASLPTLEIAPERVTLQVEMDRQGRGDLAARAFGALRGARMPAPAEIDRHYRAVRLAMDEGRLPVAGSMLPHLQFVLTRAYAEAETGILSWPDAYTAAIFALAHACGAEGFALIADRVTGRQTGGPEEDGWRRTCEEVTLSERVDIKRHFITSAALQAASNRGVAVALGEFKEIFDLQNAGFDFTDIAADLAGVRLSDRLMAAGPPLDRLAGIRSEADIMVPLDGITPLLDRATFARRFGAVDSPAYAAELAKIEARIDALPLHAAAAD